MRKPRHLKLLIIICQWRWGRSQLWSHVTHCQSIQSSIHSRYSPSFQTLALKFNTWHWNDHHPQIDQVDQQQSDTVSYRWEYRCFCCSLYLSIFLLMLHHLVLRLVQLISVNIHGGAGSRTQAQRRCWPHRSVRQDRLGAGQWVCPQQGFRWRHRGNGQFDLRDRQQV